MKRIKKFETFGYRIPTKVAYEEWNEKFKLYGREGFNQKEWDFFKKLEDNNSRLIYKMKTPGKWKNIYIEIYSNDKITDNLIFIEISKIKDDWYLIYECYESELFFICDEWDEVLGYLLSKNLNLPS